MIVDNGQAWQVRLTTIASDDFLAIIDWTAQRFGNAQAKSYAATITTALRELKAGPDTIGVRSRDDLGNGVMVFPVGRSGRRGRHLIILRADPQAVTTLQVLRILHEAMDLPRHLSDDSDTSK